MEQSVYRAKLLCKDTWAIYLGDTTAYLIAGEREGMMIDSGNTPGPLREFCEETCGRPVRLVANTHGHFDHTGGNGYFKAAFIGRLASRIAKTPNGSVRAEDFPMDYEMVIVDDGFRIDLGGREIETFVLDGHSPDSTAYLDKAARILFVGDNLGRAPMLYKCESPQPSMLRYAINLSKVMVRREEYDYILQGHNDRLVDADAVNRTLICALRAADGDLDPRPPRPTPPPGARPGPKLGNPDFVGYVEYKDAHITFDTRYANDLTRYDVVEGT